ncbi:META domain-containing protein [Flavobacterium sp. NG2]|uniref:META domain-containing protein n=1 Tax=Flavobacterium sp. NG2 TaxID=3097547 RepID=UPI002A8299A2|nr:META domain-containing protein [Flavobacterium sp. NG2]WPR70427.1 META domain-containing protein [Flavobacterium sp. NG2]
MKKIACLSLLLVFILIACKTVKTDTYTENNLDGNWQLTYISGSRIAFGGLYPDKKPEITFDTKTNKVSGHSSCNNFGSKYTIDNQKINFETPFGTRMACPGQGEQAFYTMLQKVNRYTIIEGKLLFFIDDVVMMRFEKKN